MSETRRNAAPLGPESSTCTRRMRAKKRPPDGATNAMCQGASPLRVTGRTGYMLPSSTAPSSATSLYRYYDLSDVLLYVGITSRGMSRNLEHNHDKAWWPYVVRQEVEHFPTRSEAAQRERELIQRHQPPYNVQHNPRHREVRAAYEQIVAASTVSWQDQLKAAQNLVPLTAVALGGRMRFVTTAEFAAIGFRMTLPAKKVHVRGYGRPGLHVQKLETAGLLAVLTISSTSLHPVFDAYAAVRANAEAPELRDVQVRLDHSPAVCTKHCRRPRVRAA